MSTTPDSRLSEQEALAITSALMEDRDQDAFLMITGSEDLRTLVLAACTIAAAVLKHGGIDGARYLEWRQQNLASEEN